MDFFPWLLPSFIASSTCIFLSFRIWRQRRLPATKAFYGILTFVFIWAFCQFSIILISDFFWIVILAKIQYIGIVFAPVAWFTLTMIMLNRSHLITPKFIIALCISPLITLLLVMTNEFHFFVWSEVIHKPENIIPIKVFHGSWFTFHTIYSYSLVAISALMACISFMKSRDNLFNVKTVFLRPHLLW